MYLGLDKIENWITIGIMLAVWLLALQLLAKLGLNLGSKLGLNDG